MSNTESTILQNAFKFAGEVFLVPGTSNFLDGDFKTGALHAVAGVAARVILGPVGWLAVGLNSYSKSLTGEPIYKQFRRQVEEEKEAREDAADS